MQRRSYYNQVMDEMDGGEIQRSVARRDSMGRYSRADGMSQDHDSDSSYRGTRGKHYVRGHYSRATLTGL